MKNISDTLAAIFLNFNNYHISIFYKTCYLFDLLLGGYNRHLMQIEIKFFQLLRPIWITWIG